jgi:glycosyltransferase involved in cell wall biosynthesis
VNFVDERTLAALYRRAAVLLLPSEREGFGLPVIEALASGTPVVASDLPVLREVGAQAIEYRGVGEVDGWVAAVADMLRERQVDKARWSARRQAGRSRARAFAWSQFAAAMTDIYMELAGRRLPASYAS